MVDLRLLYYLDYPSTVYTNLLVCRLVAVVVHIDERGGGDSRVTTNLRASDGLFSISQTDTE